MNNFFDSFNSVRNSVFNSNIGATKKIADPFITGYSFIKFFPGQILQREMGLDPLFFELLEKTFKEVTGLPRIELGTASIQGGFTTNEHMYPSEISKNMTEISLRFQEFTGSPYTKQFQRWVESIRDPETGLYRLSKYGLKYYSVQMMYISTNPSIGSYHAETRKEAIEQAFMITAMFPKVIDFDKYNYTSGDHAMNELEQPFSCNVHYGLNVNEIAKNYVGSQAFYDRMKEAAQSIYDGVENVDTYKNNLASLPNNSNASVANANNTNLNTVVVPQF